MLGFTRAVGSMAPAPNGADVEFSEYSHTGPPIAGKREIVAREGMIIHAAKVRGKMLNDDWRHASCNVELCRAAGSTRDKVVITYDTTKTFFAGATALRWKATITFAPEPTAEGDGSERRDDSAGSVREPTNSEFYTKLRVSMRLSMLCCADREVLTAWRETKKEVPLTNCTSFKPDEVEPVHLALEGEDAESGTHRMAQWLMAKADGVLYIAFKGTSTKDTLGKTQLHSIQLDSGVRLHSGFNAGVNDELEMILAKCTEERSNVQRVVLTGHSLGGAYAIAALLKLFGSRASSWLPCEAVTFGAPLVVVSPPSDVPPILNVVANYDIVPRLLAMTDGQVASFLTHIPALMERGCLQYIAVARGVAFQFVFPEAERFTPLSSLRERYQPVGTFVFAQSHVEGKMRRTSATVVPSGNAAGILKFDVQHNENVSADELACAVADHFPTGYWRIVKALCDDGKDQGFASYAADPSNLSEAKGRPCDWDLQERAIVNRLDTPITVTVEQHSFDVASRNQEGVVTLKIGTNITVSSTLLGNTKWNIDVPSGGLLIHKSNLLGYVARTYSVTDDGWEVGPVVSPHDARGGYVDRLAAHLVHRYPEGATVRCVSDDEPCG